MRILNNVNQIYQQLGLAELSENNLPIQSVCIDSNQTMQNSLFFGLQGKNTDGSKYYKEALKQNASLCIIKKGFLQESQKSQVLECENVFEIMSQLGMFCRQSFKGQVIGITGSNGKTTTKEILSCALPNAFATKGNFNNELGVPLNLMNLDTRHQFAAIEMGAAKAGDIKYLSSIARQDVGVITSIGRSHISGFGSLKGVLNEKSEIIKCLPKNGLAVVPFGENLNFWKSLCSSNKLVSFGLHSDADYFYQISSKDADQKNQTIDVYFKNKYLGSIITKLLGNHNVLNIGAAFAVAHNLGVGIKEFSESIADLSNIPNRLGLSNWINNSILIDDTYNANPDSVLAALTYLSGIKNRNKIAVLGDMLELGDESENYHSKIGEEAKNLGINILLGFGDLMQYAVRSFGKNGIHFKNEEELKNYLKEILSDKTVLLLKGSRGMKMERFKTL